MKKNSNDERNRLAIDTIDWCVQATAKQGVVVLLYKQDAEYTGMKQE